MASGASDLAGLAQRALSGALGSLAEDPSEKAIERASDLLQLLEFLGQGISFEAQTRFYWARAGLSPDLARRLSPLAARLGFVDP